MERDHPQNYKQKRCELNEVGIISYPWMKAVKRIITIPVLY